MAIKPIIFRNGKCLMIDQRLLPEEEVWRELDNYLEVADAIRNMIIRGAPAIGVAAAFGAAFGARDIRARNFDDFFQEFDKICSVLAATRPTAVNLSWALERLKRFARTNSSLPLKEIQEGILKLAREMAEEDEQINRTIGLLGEPLIPREARVLTHCNAGALATAGYGTALGVIRAAANAEKIVRVWVDETRPWFQGGRLTTWELHREGIPVTLVCDNMAGYLMSRGEIDCVIVGADRIAANGDVANKIGTYTLAVLCKEHGIPFYVAAPLSTIDFSLEDGSTIPIEERAPEEIVYHCGKRIAPEGIEVRNFAFDITPARLVTAVITELGVVRGNYVSGLSDLRKKEASHESRRPQ